MSVFQFIRGQVEQSSSMVSQAQNISQNVMQQIQSYPNIVGNAWIGGDADSFAEKVVTKLLPAIAELIAAIAGINLNLTDATSAVDEADQKIQGMAGQLGDLFGSI
jgi:uncharacterized protein YukE